MPLRLPVLARLQVSTVRCKRYPKNFSATCTRSAAALLEDVLVWQLQVASALTNLNSLIHECRP